MKFDHYFHGDGCLFTGNVSLFAQGIFYEYMIAEGPRYGDLIGSQVIPAHTQPIDASPLPRSN